MRVLDVTGERLDCDFDVGVEGAHANPATSEAQKIPTTIERVNDRLETASSSGPKRGHA